MVQTDIKHVLYLPAVPVSPGVLYFIWLSYLPLSIMGKHGAANFARAPRDLPSWGAQRTVQPWPKAKGLVCTLPTGLPSPFSKDTKLSPIEAAFFTSLIHTEISPGI